jgi:hypothetical protein
MREQRAKRSFVNIRGFGGNGSRLTARLRGTRAKTARAPHRER